MSDGCQYTPVDCDDGVSCTVDTCNPATGCVHTPDDALCDDENPCTDDSCDPDSGCLHTFNTLPCITEDGEDGTCSAGVCEPNPCVPTGVCPPGANCGTVPDGCGDEVTCGPATCQGVGQSCGGGGTPNICGGTAICLQTTGCDQGTCGPAGSGCYCTSSPDGDAFCFLQGCGAPCTSNADCRANGVQTGLCSVNTGGCCGGNDCILFENIDVCSTTASFGVASFAEGSEEFTPVERPRY